MKLHDNSSTGYNTFTAYGEGYIAVNGTTYRRSLIVAPQQIDAAWSADADALCANDLNALLAYAGHIVLLGTGTKQRFPAPALLRPLALAGLAVEVMDSFAACRTYNILVAEGRPVVAALLLPALPA
jgi:uncharacterized protein